MTYTLRLTVEKLAEENGTLVQQHKAIIESNGLTLKDTTDMQAPLLAAVSDWLAKDEE